MVNWRSKSSTEDRLTGTVFSVVSYLPEAWEALHQAIHDANGDCSLDAVAHEDLRFEPWPAWDVPRTDAEIQARAQQRVSPDLVIESSKWVLVVEAEHSKNHDVPQIVKQLSLACDTIYPSKQVFLLHVSPMFRPDVVFEEKLMNALEDTRRERAQVLWLGWAAVHRALSNLRVAEPSLIPPLQPFHPAQKLQRLQQALLRDAIDQLVDDDFGSWPPPHASIREAADSPFIDLSFRARRKNDHGADSKR